MFYVFYFKITILNRAYCNLIKTIKQNNFLEFPYDLHNAKKLVIYSGGRAKPFHLTSYFGEIESIKHKHKSTIKGKEASTSAYYFEVKLKANFSEDISIENNPNIKKWMKEYREEYELESVNYLPVLTFAENVF